MLGFSTFAEFPFATVAKDNNVTITVTGNALTVSFGNPGITADANIYPSGNSLVISSGTVTITADANVSSTGNALTLGTGTAQAITWSAIVPGVSMVWTPIDPS